MDSLFERSSSSDRPHVPGLIMQLGTKATSDVLYLIESTTGSLAVVEYLDIVSHDTEHWHRNNSRVPPHKNPVKLVNWSALTATRTHLQPF